MSFSQIPKSFKISAVAYVVLIVAYASNLDTPFRMMTSIFENSMLFLCVFTLMSVPISDMTIYRFPTAKDMIFHILNERFKTMYVFLIASFILKLSCLILVHVDLDWILFLCYCVFVLFSYTLICTITVLLLLLPKSKYRTVLSYLYFFFTLGLLFINSDLASIICPLVFVVNIVNLNTFYFIFCIMCYAMIYYFLIKKIETYDWS